MEDFQAELEMIGKSRKGSYQESSNQGSQRVDSHRIGMRSGREIESDDLEREGQRDFNYLPIRRVQEIPDAG